METRTITEIKIYTLALNPMQGNTEASTIVAIAYEKEKLEQWYKNQFAEEPWKDYGENSFPSKVDMGGYSNTNHCWHKVFKKGSALEWYNPINLFDPNSMEGIGYGHGISEQWTSQESIDNFNSQTGRLIE